MTITLTDDEVRDLIEAMDAVASAIYSMPSSASDFVGPMWREFCSWQERLDGGEQCPTCGRYDRSLSKASDWIYGLDDDRKLCGWCIDDLLNQDDDEDEL